MIRIVLTTTDSSEEAHRLAQELVTERLAACVNIIPEVTSVYKWEGKLEKSKELLLFIKTTDAQVTRLTGRLEELHSYDVPEILVLPIDQGSPDYMKWVAGEVLEEPDGSTEA